MSPTAPPDVRDSLVDAWSRSIDDVLALARSLDEADAATPTDLPGWTVQDVLAHLAALEAELAGDPPLAAPDSAIPADARDNPFRAHMERGVAARRGRSLTEVVAELEDAVGRRRAALAADPPSDLSAPGPGIGGAPWTWETLLRNRVIDVWMHEQDIRRAVGQPGGWDSPAAETTLVSFAGSLGYVLGRRVKPEPGTVVRWRVGDAEDFTAWEVTLRVEPDGRARPVDDPDLITTSDILMSTEQFMLACGGRRPVDEIGPALTGDTDLARRVVAAMAVTG
jgi:uncharacterized protein (TIGR03083 family)